VTFYWGISQISILSEITTVHIMNSRNRIKDEIETMDERTGYLKSLLIRGKWIHRWIYLTNKN
jgi:hypothetical protein